MKTAFLFSGQGAQHPGMGKDLYDNYAIVRAIFDSSTLDFDVKQLCFEGPKETLMIHNMLSLQSSYTAWLVQRCYVLLALKQMCALAYHWENTVPYVMRMLSQLKMVRRSLLSEARSWPMHCLQESAVWRLF